MGEFKGIRMGTYAQISGIASPDENILYLADDKAIPIPAQADAGKVPIVNASGAWGLGNISVDLSAYRTSALQDVIDAGKADISTGNTVPTVATVGNVGSFYFNLVTKKLYKCLGTNPASVLTVTNGTESGNFRFRFNTTVRQLMADAGMTITVSFPAQLEGELVWNYWFFNPNSTTYAYVHRTEASQSFNYQKLVLLSSDGTMSGTISYHWGVRGDGFYSREDSYSGSATSANYGNGEGFYLNGSNPEPVYIYSSSGTYIGDIASAKFTPNDVGISMGFVEQEYSVQYIWEEVVLADALTTALATKQDVIPANTYAPYSHLSDSSAHSSLFAGKLGTAHATASDAHSSLFAAKLDANLKGAAGGVAELDANGKVPSAQLPALLELGESETTAYRGDRGKVAYDHSQDTSVHVTAAQKSAWTAKQDAISDLATIRSGAAAGATAVQPATVDGKLHTVDASYGLVMRIDNTPLAADTNTSGESLLPSDAALAVFVAKENGKGLSTNDYTTAEKNKLAGIASGATAVSEGTVSGWGFTKNAGTITGITMNGSSKGTSGVVNLGTVLTSHQDISGKQDNSNLVTSVSSASTDAQYPSAKCLYDMCGNIESALQAIRGV